MAIVDTIIVGQGIAGSTLAWNLHWLGQRIAIIDRGEANSASRVASGLISPVAGRRNAVSRQFDELWSVAENFYRQVERETGKRFLHRRAMLRVQTEDGIGSENPEQYVTGSTKLPAPLNPRTADILEPAARLDVPTFLAATRRSFEINTVEAELNPHDVQTHLDKVTIPKLDLETERLIFCQGISAQSNPFLAELQFEPTKGEILTLRIPEFSEDRVISHNVWLAPRDDGTCLCGATYDREFENDQPTAEGRREILDKLTSFGPKEYEVVDHRAAVRPTLHGRLPKVGFSRQHRRVGFFNGLGSKGALRAPSAARQFARHIVRDEPLDSELRLQPFRKPFRLTESAHSEIARVLSSGDVAIDATAGNGYDTLFLANAVGELGHVYAFDIQPEAIERTSERLQTEGVKHVTLVEGSHARLREFIPESHHGKVAAVMFNLGYLPRGDKQITTRTESTLGAVEQSIELLRPGGMMTIVAYVGHSGGLEEAEAVEQLLREGSSECDYTIYRNDAPESPWLFVVTGRVK